MAQASGGTRESRGAEARAMFPSRRIRGMNSGPRGRWPKVKISLGLGESRVEEPANLRYPRVWTTPILDVERGAGVRESQGIGHRIPVEARVDIARIEPVP